MSLIKTAISIQKPLFDQVNELAEKMKMPRSRLFVRAVEEFIKQNQNRMMLETLDEVYREEPNPEEKDLLKRMRIKHRKMVEGQW